MSEDQSSNEGAHPQPDPTISKIDELIAQLARWRALLVEIGDPSAAASEADTRVRALLPIVRSLPAIAASVDAEVHIVSARLTNLASAAAERGRIERAVERLHAAIVDPKPTETEVREKLADYLPTLPEKIRMGMTSEEVADWLVRAVVSRWPVYGRRLQRRRPALVERLTKLAARGPGLRTKGEVTAAQLREEILGWMFESGSRDAVKGVRRRAQRRANK